MRELWGPGPNARPRDTSAAALYSLSAVGDDGLDELTTTGHSRIWEVTRGDIHEHDLDPRDLGETFP